MAAEGRIMSEICVQVNKLKKSFNGRTVVDDVSFEVEKGTAFGLWELRNNNVNRLSGGEKQKLSVALALVGKPVTTKKKYHHRHRKENGDRDIIKKQYKQ